MKNTYLLFAFIIFSFGCSQDQGDSTISNSKSTSQDYQVFQLIEDHGINFNNLITETASLNTINNDALINGGGVGIIDVNNDGLQDIYFAGNMVSDKLFLNKGNLKFEDISKEAGIIDKTWSSGISIIDINNDGYQDIYVCKYLYDKPELRKNKLYINKKNNTFSEESEKYGLADNGYSVMANFFDYDGDQDLDVYVVNQLSHTKGVKDKIKSSDIKYSDNLYRNDNGTFTKVTKEAGIERAVYSLSATVSDVNNDGHQDIYVAADFEEPDMMFINKGDGTFTDEIHSSMKHLSNFSMGTDIADINNDGLMDIFTADMVAEDNFRNKTNMSGMAIDKFWGYVNKGYHHQYMFNTLQLNNGNGTFSEIAQMSGISKTDWSWAPLFVDADQDGFKDLFVTNGILKELRNKDYIKKIKEKIKAHEKINGKGAPIDALELTSMAPSVKIKNKAYRNTGDLLFENKTDNWGFSKPGWSQGMAYADLDNDGDMDLVINNMNEEADIYENQTNLKHNYLKIKAKGPQKNTSAINTKVTITYGKNTQVAELSPYRGYMSSCENLAHFGLGDLSTIDQLVVKFPDGTIVQKQNIKTNQTLNISYSEGKKISTAKKSTPALFAPKNTNLDLTYQENDFNDYGIEVLIPYKASQLGPFMTKGDVNGDGNEDFYIGGAIGHTGKIVLQSDNGQFTIKEQPQFKRYKGAEDGGASFFDIDNDGDLDLYVCGGGYEFPLNSKAYQDRLYINDGQGNFAQVEQFPTIDVSTSSVSTYDIDKDGDLDIFVGGRITHSKYGHKVSSYLLRTDPNGITDISSESPDLQGLGMITGSVWADIDGDNIAELIVCGEWMKITILKLENGKLVKSQNTSLQDSEGLWNTIQANDIDNDGDIDLIAGNYGLNYKYKASLSAPLELYVDDFDDNGSNDVYLGYHDESDGKLYPVRGRQCSSEQMPFVEDKFEDYEAFGKATVIDILDGKLEDGSLTEKAKTIAHTIFINNGSGSFDSKTLPNRAQVAPIYDMVIDDFNNDGHKDILAVGNFYQREVETTRSDAGTGSLILGNGRNEFQVLNALESGIAADQDVRAITQLKNKSGNTVIAIANNGSKMQFYSKK